MPTTHSPSPYGCSQTVASILLKVNPQHPSLRFKRVGRLRSARVGMHYRALGVDVSDGVLWFWIGTHADYDTLIS